MATIKGTRSPLFYRHLPGGLPAIVDVSKFSGNIYFVDSNAAQAADTVGKGYHPDYPFATIDYAVGQCTASQGDAIIVLPGHVETVIAAAGLALDVAGITIVFAGDNARGYITFTTAVTADMNVDAADITMINPRFVAGIDALTGPIDVNAARFRVVNGTCEDGTTINTTDWVVGDANADDIDIDGLTFIDGDAAGTQKQSFIQIAGATRPKLKRIRATGDFGTGVIENGTAWIDALLDDIVIDNANAGPVVGILLQATSSGTARNVNVRVASGTTYVTANNDMQWFECWGVGTDAAAGDNIGTAPAASIEGKIDTLQAEVSGAAGLVSFPAGAAAANAISLAEVIRYIQENIISAGGTVLPAAQSLYDVLAGANGVATWAAGAAPTNGVSMAEAIRYIAEQIIRGTGTILPDNQSIYDLIAGANGIATWAAGATPANGVSMAEALRYLVDQIIRGTGTILPDNQSLYDLIAGANGIATWAAAAAPANNVSLSEAIRYVVETQIGTLVNAGGTATLGGIIGDVANSSIATRLTSIAAGGIGTLVRKTVTYTGAVSYAAFTITGKVAVKMLGCVTTALTNHADSTSVGTATSAAGLIAATAGTAMQTIDQLWTDNAPSKFETLPANYYAISESIAVVGTANIVGGVVDLYCLYIPLSSNGAVVAA